MVEDSANDDDCEYTVIEATSDSGAADMVGPENVAEAFDLKDNKAS